MIKVYYRKGCNSSNRSLDWLKKYNLPMKTIRVGHIQRADLIEVLRLCEEGVDDLLRHPHNVQELGLSEVSMGDCLSFLEHHTNLIRSPIIIEEDNLLIGFNEEQMRQFLPKAFRRYEALDI